jgi:hypothetical protein
MRERAQQRQKVPALPWRADASQAEAPGQAAAARLARHPASLARQEPLCLPRGDAVGRSATRADLCDGFDEQCHLVGQHAPDDQLNEPSHGRAVQGLP